MFQTKDVSAFLQQLKFTADGDNVIAHGTFYLTPISYALAYEVDTKMADRLFRKRGGEWLPCAEVPSIAFDLKVDAQAMTYVTHKDITTGRGFIPHVAIEKIRAFKLFADDPNFTLAFDCRFQCDDRETTWFLIHRMKKPLLLSFQALQGKLEFPKPALLCEICEEPATHRTSPGKSLVCKEHVGAYVGETVEPLDPAYEAKTSDLVKAMVDANRKKGKPVAKKKKAARKAK